MPASHSDLDSELVAEIIALTRHSGMRMRRRFADTGLAAGPSMCLLALSKLGPVPTSRLAQELGVRGPTLTELVDGLEADGLVRRSPSPDDRRITVLSATPRGEKIFQRIHNGVVKEWRQILAKVPAARKRAWTEMLREIRALAQEDALLDGGAA